MDIKDYDTINYKFFEKRYVDLEKQKELNGNTEILINKNIYKTDLLKDFSNFKIFFDNESSPDTFIKIDCQNEIYFKNRLNNFLEEYSAIDFFTYPNELFLVGGFLNIVLDKELDIKNKYFKLCDLDFFIISDRPLKILNNIIKKIKKIFGEENLEIKKIDRQSVLIKYNNCRTISIFISVPWFIKKINDSFLKSDFSHLHSAYDGKYLTLTKDSWNAIYTKKTNYYFHQIWYQGMYLKKAPLRFFKTICRGYQINGYDIDMEQLLKNEEIQKYISDCNK